MILIIALLLLAVWWGQQSNLWGELSLENLQKNKAQLDAWVGNNYLLTVVVFIIVYFVAVLVSLPGAVILTLAGGYMFGPFGAALYINVGATLGATALFVAIRYFIGGSIQQKYAKALAKFNQEIAENGQGYFLTIRFIPVFPFFLINLLAGLTKVRLTTFIWTTAVGIFPGSLVYAYAGSNLKTINSVGDILSLEIFFAFLALGVFALVPIVWKKLASLK